MHFVYVLQSEKDKGYYIGCTSNLERRLISHNSGKTPSLKQRRPLKVIYVERYNTATDAFNREKQIKKYKGGEAFKKLIKHGRVA